MPNIIGRYAEGAECQTGAMPNKPNAKKPNWIKHMLCVTLLVTFV